MIALKLNSKGSDVKKWQYFLAGLGYVKVKADGHFGAITEAATKDFQKKNKLKADGVAGQLTLLKAMEMGFMLIENPPDQDRNGLHWPALPDFKPLTTGEMERKFGKFEYTPLANGNISIKGSWKAENIVRIEIPQIKNIGPYFPKSLELHKLAAKPMQDLFNAWEKAGLLKYVLSYNGCYVPRLMRGLDSLSRHAWGTAFDINVAWNGLGVMPPKANETGTVRPLVQLAHKHGFYWGGHFGRKDGMHFELAVLK